MLKLLAIGGAAAIGGLWLFVPGGYTRDVDSPPAEVLAAPRDLDISRQPGAPGFAPVSDVMRGGGTGPARAPRDWNDPAAAHHDGRPDAGGWGVQP